ncbi:PREDICTED: uncharacterized protein LOC108354561, partial [Rhagoletis zephyria]|uniref:uncharacterized protein LOC108354561 n=1 Tax=Rhagoletis zephyria TaxID=28612 RepID=UPI000811734D
MESKRSNYQTLHKPQSSKIQVLKTASEVSLTPSQAAEQAKISERKNPLDALSRLSLRHQGLEKRSGLQDVDDEYLKKNVFSRSILNKHSGLNDTYEQHGRAISLVNLAQGNASHIQMQKHEAKQQSTPHLTQVQPTSQSPQAYQAPTEFVSHQQVPIHQPQSSSAVQCKNQSYEESHLTQPLSPPKSHQHSQQQSMPASIAPVVEPEL